MYVCNVYNWTTHAPNGLSNKLRFQTQKGRRGPPILASLLLKSMIFQLEKLHLEGRDDLFMFKTQRF